ncbi:MAG: hypothetical protein IPP74_14830 [Alphaproteobacteria bacterium]|nr:hypothetical protein [Alphaproteobacteria bacterium]
MSWISDVGGWIGNNSDWIKPIVGAGLGAYKQSQTDNAQSQYLDYLRQREQQNYDNSVAQINAYNTQGAQAGSGGGGGNDAARMAAAAKGQHAMDKTYKQLLAMYAPYRQTADRLLPQMTQTYENSLGLQNGLMQFLNSPSQVAKLNGSIPAYNVNVPLPDSVRMK